MPERSALRNADKDWITSGLSVLGALGTVVGVLGWLLRDFLILLAFVAGAGWALCISLLVLQRRAEREGERRETEIADLRLQVSEWKSVATKDSETLNAVVTRRYDPPRVRPRRIAASDAIDMDDGGEHED